MCVEHEEELFDFFVQYNLMAKDRVCLLCGNMMRKKKDGKHYLGIAPGE